MKRYYFDLLDQHGLEVDEENLEFRDLEAVEREAAQAVADAAAHCFEQPVASSESSIGVAAHLLKYLPSKMHAINGIRNRASYLGI